MGKLMLNGPGGAGVGSDECTARKDDVLKGMRAVTADSADEVVEGILELTGDAADSQVLEGRTYYNTNPKSKRTGTMINCGAVSQALNAGGSYTIPAGYHNGSGKVTANSLASQTGATATAAQILGGQTAWVNGNKLTGTMGVQSILSFSAAVYSSTAIMFTWQNPAKGPFSGVIIVGKTNSYPTSISDGTRYYKGSGSNSSASGVSSVTISNFGSGTTYYFRTYSYATKDNAEWVHTSSYTAAASTTRGQQVFTASGTFSVPAGVRSVDLFSVGGGAGGGNGISGSNGFGGWGGCGGKTTTVKGKSITPGDQITVVVGNGGAAGASGSPSYCLINGSQVCIANGGEVGKTSSVGGSGGGAPCFYKSDYPAGNGGADGSNGGTAAWAGSQGQQTTTRAFGESGNTLYAGGGGGGGNYQNGTSYRGIGGGGGGGNGADVMQGGSSGAAGTGGGGGGGYNYATAGNGFTGGSGIFIVRWGY